MINGKLLSLQVYFYHHNKYQQKQTHGNGYEKRNKFNSHNMAGIHIYYPYNIYDIHENVSASVFTITAIVMSQNMKPSSPAQPPSPAGSQARSMFSGSLFQVGTPHQPSTSMVSYRNFKIFQYTISTQCAYLFTIKLWQNKRSDMQNIGEELGTGTVFMFLYTLLKK